MGRKLGQGGFSKVYLARHRQSNKYYAIKKVYRMIDNRDKSKHVKQEIDVLFKLHHPNIIKIYNSFETKKHIYLVLEYLQHIDLPHFLKEHFQKENFQKERPSETTILKIVIQIAKALQYCHDHGIIHRDVKLSNVLIDKHENVKLIDFGLCVVKDYDSDVFHSNSGTTRFKAPEVINKQSYNESIDIWSFGVVIYYLLTNHYPFDGAESTDIEAKIKLNQYSYDHLAPLQLDLIQNMLVLDSFKRFTINQVLQHPWLSQASTESPKRRHNLTKKYSIKQLAMAEKLQHANLSKHQSSKHRLPNNETKNTSSHHHKQNFPTSKKRCTNPNCNCNIE